MIKKKIKKLNVNIGENFKNDKIVLCFLIFSSNKFVESLLVKFNSFFIKYEYKKKKKSKINCKFIYLSVSLSNYIYLKKELIFEFNKEHLKFKFMYVLFNNEKFSIDFFEKGYLSNINKEEGLNFLNKYILINILLKNVFFLKIMFLFYYIFIKMLNNLNFSVLSSIFLYNTDFLLK